MAAEAIFPDVAFHRGSLWVCWMTQAGGRLVVTRDGVEYLTVDLPGSLGFPRLHEWDDTLWLGYHLDGHLRAQLRRLDPDGPIRELAPCQSNDPLCFGSRWFAWQGAQKDGWPISRLNLETGDVVPAGHGIGTGLSRVLEDGTVRTVDEDRFAIPGFTRPCWAGDLIVAEGKETSVQWFLPGGRTGTLWPGVPSFTPRCAVDLDRDRVAIVTWGGQAAIRQWVGSRSQLPTGDAPVPVPVPVPVPQPQPEPTPVPDIPESLEREVQRIWQQYGGAPDKFGDIINEVAYLHRDKGWGLSAKPSGHNAKQPRTGILIATDILQNRNYPSPHDLWDCIDSAGKPTWIQAAPHNDPNRPWVAPVQPDGAPVPGPGPQPGPVPDVNTAVDARIAAALAAAVKPLEARLKALENQPAPPSPQPFPSRIALKSAHGPYGSVQPDGSIVFDRDNPGSWETFTVEPQ